ncbi:HAD-IA family hydrolase [Kitasatospora cinereorecta]|uniref:HAD-IA family hydrolase n=1 Tax=Kitasatospora cinereorecta TaxID=285560 RepID=A0ABW0VD98_9ACTN
MGGETFEAVLCDLDGVLRLWDPDGMTGLDRQYGLPEGSLAAAAFRAERLLPAVTGAVTDEQWRAAVAGDLAEPCGSAGRAAELVAAWGRQANEVDHEVLALLTAVRRRMPVVLVSNATTRLERDLTALGLDTAVDAVVNTARIGVAKPDERVYRIAAERAGVPPQRCLFVDDTPANVVAARAVGMTGHHYRDPAGLRALLTG